MKETRRNLVVGIFVLCGLGALGVLVVLFGQGYSLSLRKPENLVRIQFESATGIRADTLVTIGGLEVGRVYKVEFADPARFDAGVDVWVSINPPYVIRQGSRAYTSEPGLGMGRPPIEIIPGPAEAPPQSPDEPIPGRVAKAVESLIPPSIIATLDKTATQLGEAAAALTPVLNDMHEIMMPRTPATVDTAGGPPGNLSSAMARFDASLRHFNEVLGDPAVQSHLKTSIENIRTMTEDGKTLAADLKVASSDIRSLTGDAKVLVGKMTSTVENADTQITGISRALIGNLELASAMLTQMNTMMESAIRGEGTLGKFVKDDRLYESMTLTFRRLAETVEEFKLLAKEWQEGRIRVAF